MRLGDGLAHRQVVPELLDHLGADHPDAVASRRDLVRLNALMGHAGLMARLIARHAEAPPRQLADIGAGDGRFMLSVGRRMARHWPKVELTLVDRTALIEPRRRAALEALGWTVEVVRADVFDWLESPRRQKLDVIAANLFLHHFEAAALRRLLSAAAERARLVAAVEPRRGTAALLAARLLPALGVGRVTRHDAPASVRAGFCGSELTAAWPAAAGAVREERGFGPFSHLFAAGGGKEGGGA